MPVLWLRFPEEVLSSAAFSNAEKEKMEKIFSVQDSGSCWNKALRLLDITNELEEGSLLYWHQDIPYFNWSALTRVISGGTIHVIQEKKGYSFRFSKTLHSWLSLAKSQWKIARFLQQRLDTQYLPDKPDARLAESIALGLALQSLVMRLGSEADKMPHWLSRSSPAPRRYRKTVSQIQDVQLRRTALSHAWHEAFPQRREGAERLDLLEFFWDEPGKAVPSALAARRSEVDKWTGLPVCAGKSTGRAVVINKISEAYLASEKVTQRILVFRRARPETTELFQYAGAIVFAEGGVLSHACVVAREMNIPCVTGLGADFYEQIKNQQGIMLAVDGNKGTIEIIR